MHLVCSRLSTSVAIEKAGGRRVGSLWCGQLKKRAGDEQGLVEKEGATGEPVSIALKTSFQYTSYWYTLWLVTFNSLYQHLVCLSEGKRRWTWRAWYTGVISRRQNLLKRSEWVENVPD